jgi:hypothetical protein
MPGLGILTYDALCVVFDTLSLGDILTLRLVNKDTDNIVQTYRPLRRIAHAIEIRVSNAETARLYLRKRCALVDKLGLAPHHAIARLNWNYTAAVEIFDELGNKPCAIRIYGQVGIQC